MSCHSTVWNTTSLVFFSLSLSSSIPLCLSSSLAPATSPPPWPCHILSFPLSLTSPPHSLPLCPILSVYALSFGSISVHFPLPNITKIHNVGELPGAAVHPPQVTRLWLMPPSLSGFTHAKSFSPDWWIAVLCCCVFVREGAFVCVCVYVMDDACVGLLSLLQCRSSWALVCPAHMRTEM